MAKKPAPKRKPTPPPDLSGMQLPPQNPIDGCCGVQETPNVFNYPPSKDSDAVSVTKEIERLNQEIQYTSERMKGLEVELQYMRDRHVTAKLNHAENRLRLATILATPNPAIA